MKKTIFLFILFIILFGLGYIYWFYFNIYSDGSREGILYKFSRKGNVFKTFEGEIIQPGLRSVQGGVINTNNLSFSVIDIALADSLNKVIGKNVKLHYIQYRKNLPWRGDNYNNNDNNQNVGQYIVDRIEKVEDVNPNIGL